MVAGYGKNIGASLKRPSHHPTPEPILFVKLHEIGTDDTPHGAGIGWNHGSAISHDHVTIVEEKICLLPLDRAQHSRQGLGVLKPVLVLTGDWNCRGIGLDWILPRIPDGGERQHESLIFIIVCLCGGNTSTEH